MYEPSVDEYNRESTHIGLQELAGTVFITERSGVVTSGVLRLAGVLSLASRSRHREFISQML